MRKRKPNTGTVVFSENNYHIGNLAGIFVFFFKQMVGAQCFTKRTHHLQQAALVFAHVLRCLLPSTGILQSVLLLHSLIAISLSKPLTCLLRKGCPFYSTLLQAQDYRWLNIEMKLFHFRLLSGLLVKQQQQELKSIHRALLWLPACQWALCLLFTLWVQDRLLVLQFPWFPACRSYLVIP